jgi:hypothetical protein
MLKFIKTIASGLVERSLISGRDRNFTVDIVEGLDSRPPLGSVCAMGEYFFGKKNYCSLKLIAQPKVLLVL